MTKISLTKTSGGGNAPIEREHKALLENAEIFGDIKKDRNGNPWATIKFNFTYTSGGEDRKTSYLTNIPYSLNEGSVALQIFELAGAHWSTLKDGEKLDLDLAIFDRKDCTIHIGSEIADYSDKNGVFKEGQPKMYENSNGELKLSSSVIGVYPYKSFGSTWTEAKDAEQKTIYDSYLAIKEARELGNRPARASDVENMDDAFDA